MTVVPEMTPAQLAAEESETAEQLFEEHSGWIYGYCLRVLRSPEEAEDALQTTYLNVCRSLNQGTRPRAGSAWLLRIARNVCFTRLRASGRRSRVERVQDVTFLEATVAAPDRAQDDLVGLTGALLGIPEQQRKAILLREWKGLSYAEIATELELTQSAVEALIFRARRSLATGLESPNTRPRLRSLHVFDLAGLLAGIKGFLAGSAGVKTVAALTVAAATTATAVATDPVGVFPDRQSLGRAQVRPADSEAASRARSVVGAPIVENDVRSSAVERRQPVRDGDRAKGKPTAAPPKPKTKGNGNGQTPSGNGNGRTEAPGQVKKAEGAAHGPNGRGVTGGGKPDSPAQGGPPPHANAKGLEKSKKAKAAH